MAKSLRCNQCNTLLKSVAEAQAHSEATGHVDFEETTEVIKVLVCKECGKPCRTQAERDLHTKFTQHTEFVDKTDAAAVVNTESEMKAAAAALAADSDEEMANAGEEGGEAEMVPVEVDPEMLSGLVEMGFPENRAKRAVHFSGASTVEGAINWLVEHEGDADIDEPLLVPKADKKPKLSAEEARAKAEELVRKARERREREEREAERLRELERIRMGKEIQAAKRAEEDQALRRNAEARRREKEEDARYREQLRKKLEEDRKERRRKLGLPEEPTEEEVKADAEKAAAKAREEAERKKPFVVAKPISVIDKLRSSLVAMKKAAPQGEPQFKTAAATLLKYLGNIAANPNEDKYRSIRLSNAAFQQRVAPVPGHLEFLKLCGFQEEGEVLRMPRDAVAPEVLQAAGSELNNALTNPFFGAL